MLFSTIEHEEAQEEQAHEGRELDELGEQASLSSDMLEEAVTRLEERLGQAAKEGCPCPEERLPAPDEAV